MLVEMYIDKLSLKILLKYEPPMLSFFANKFNQFEKYLAHANTIKIDCSYFRSSNNLHLKIASRKLIHGIESHQLSNPSLYLLSYSSSIASSKRRS